MLHAFLLLALCFSAGACGAESSGGGPAATGTPVGGPAAASGGSDVEFAREVFLRLASGDAAVEEMIDWENLQVLGEDYGAEYRRETDEAMKAEARRDFIEGFSRSFKSEGGSNESFTNWREESKEGARTTVAADGAEGNKLLFTVTRADGRRKVAEIAALEKVGS